MNMNNFTSAMVIWNLLLNQYGRPHHNRPDSNQPPTGTTGGGPIGYNIETGDYFIKSMYYTIGHFSKYIKRGAVRIGSSTYNDSIKTAAFRNPDGEIVVVILNTGDRDANAPKIRLNNCTADFNLPAKSLITTVISTK
jgi:glucosylceramidase